MIKRAILLGFISCSIQLHGAAESAADLAWEEIMRFRPKT